MKYFIADIEVFCSNWIFVCKEVESDEYTVIHNDNYRLREFFNFHSDDIFGFFNGKHYDVWIIMSMLLGADNETVKRHNDFIINKEGNAWEFPFVQFQKRPFNSFDLKDDLPQDLGLKAIEGNLNLPIVESSIPFDINRKLTSDELDEVIRYCKYDVDATVKLYNERKEKYIDAKALICDMYDVPKADGIGLTNAKLCAKILGA